MTVHILDGNKQTRTEARAEAEPSTTADTDLLGAQQLGDGPSAATDEPSSLSAPEEWSNQASEATVVQYLERTLERVQAFRGLLSDGYDRTKHHLYPPLVIIASKKTPTVRGAIIDNHQELLDGNFDRLLFGEGDGIILHSSATALPSAWHPHLQATIESRHGQ